MSEPMPPSETHTLPLLARRDAGETETLAPSAPAAPVSADSLTIPGYEIISTLGRGGMGVVYQARQSKLGRIVALKMILSGVHAGEADLARFRTEAEAIARLQHPNIVQIYEVGDHGGLPFFSLEFCGGGSLEKKLAGTPLPPKEAALLVEGMARAMQAAHDKGVIHRDLKPANVLLAEDGTPKITDFGFAKKLDDAGQTASGAVMGTPSYMAPEQAGGKSKEIGPACDVYALGAILYECLTGRPPFKAATPLDTIMQVVSDEPVPPSHLQTKTPRDLETICLKCLHKEAHKRYATARELANDLRRFLNGEPIIARPVGRIERAAKWVKRNPLVTALLLATVLVTVLGVAGIVWKYLDAEQQKSIAVTQKEEAQRQLLFSSRLAAGRSDVEFRTGNPRDSLSWMLEAYELAPREDSQRLDYLHQIGFLGRGGVSDVALWHDGAVYAASFSPDGRTVVTASMDNTARLWDAASGKELQRLTHGVNVRAASFSPDGRTVVTAGGGGARLWDVASGKELHQLNLTGSAASFSPDGRTILTTSGWDKAARLWDATSGRELLRLPHDNWVDAVSFSPDGRMVATASQDKTARLWDTASGKELQRLTHDGLVRAASFSPDGRTVVTASYDGTARLWDATSGRELLRLPHGGSVEAASFSPDGRTVVTGANGNPTVRLWDATSGRELLRLMHDGAVLAASFSPDGRTVVTASGDKTARLWDAATATEMQGLARKYPGPNLISAARQDKINRLWEADFLSIPDHPDPDRLRAWVLVRTGQDFTAEGTLHPLSKEEWEQQRQTLDARGGDWQRPLDPRKWHLVEAADAEADKSWFAARFHLNWLLKDDATNADLLRRRDEAEKHLKAP